MATARKLPSGNWRVREYSHTDENGKKCYVSFTASTKAAAEAKGRQWAEKKGRTSGYTKTVAQCIDDYIVAKTPALSPSTIRSYRNLQAKYYVELREKDVNKLSNADVQNMINSYKGQVSVKTIKNILTLFTASLKYYSKDLVFNVQLPQKEIIDDISTVEQRSSATNEEVMTLFRMASPWMQKCIALAAFSGMRRGEIAALTYKDVLADRNKIFVHMAYTMDEDNNWVLKPPKTEGSIRLAPIPAAVIALLGTGAPDQLVIGYNPNTISKMFNKLKNRMDIDISFHDLRHYYASIGNVLHIPDVTLAEFGGWTHDSTVMKTVYQDKVSDIADGYAKKMNTYFDDLIKGKSV